MIRHHLQKWTTLIAVTSVIISAALIAAPAQIALAANTGYLSPSANLVDTGGDNDGFETNPTGAYADGGGSAANNNGRDDRHRYYNYNINVPAGETITGIEVRLDGWTDTTSFSRGQYRVELSWDGGSNWSSTRTTGDLPTGGEGVPSTLGGASDDWGHSGWTATELNNANFRVRITSLSNSSSRDFFLDWVAVRVTYNLSPYPPINPIPANGALIASANPTFTWSDFDDPNLGDSQSQFQVQLGQGPNNYSPAFRDYTSPINTNGSSFDSATVPWNLPDGYYCWHVRVRDNSLASNDWSAYSAEACFTKDANPPSSSATSPAYANAPFQVTATATDAGVGVANVKLYFRGPGGSWIPTGATISAPGPYQWTFTPALGDGTYYFQSVACDNAGNCETTPMGTGGSGDSNTIYDASAPSSTATPPAGPLNAAPIAILWTANGNVSGIAANGVALWVKTPGGGSFVATGLTSSSTSGTFDYIPAAGDGTYCFYTIATDNATNVEAAPASPNGDGCTIYKTRSTIGDLVWLDTNGNGFRDAGEPGIDGVTLTLMRGLAVSGTATTSGGGAYLFSNLPGPQIQTVRDNFGSNSYANNNGTVNWAGNWIESDTGGGGATGGNVVVSTGQLRLSDSPNSVARDANLSGAATATLSFDFGTQNVESGDTAVVEVSSDGGANYIILETFSASVSGSRSYDISAYISADTRIRFRLSAGYTGTNEEFAVDNVQIQYLDVSQSTYTVVVDASNFNPGGPLNGLNATSDVASPFVVALTTIGQDVTSADFGFGPFAVVGDLIYQDTNRNGAFDSGEPGLPNITVWLYTDGNANGKIDGADAVIRTTSTDANGLYALRGVPSGNYTVLADVNDPDLPGAFRPTSPNPVAVPNVTAPNTYSNADIGFNTPPPVTKELYLRTLTDLTRNRPTGLTPSTVQILSSDSVRSHAVTWSMPAGQTLAGPITFVNGQPVQAILRIQSNPSASALSCGGQLPDVTVTLGVVGGATLATATINDMPAGLNTRTFDLNIPAGTTIAAGSRLQLKIDASGADCGLNPPQDEDADGYIVVYFDSLTDLSRLEMPVVSYIKFDQAGTYDAAYPGGALTPVFIQGDTVYFRATASDPFGAFDISGATLTVPGIVNNSAMGVAASGSLTKTFQSSLPSLLGGNYTYIITATEGSEAQVSATVTGTFSIIVSNLGNSFKTVDKAVASPGSVLTYTIELSNTGGLNANVRMTDTLPANVTYLSGPTGPAGSSYNAGLNAILFNGQVPANGKVTLTYRATVNTPLDNGTIIANDVTIDDGFSRFNTSPPAVTTIQSAPNLSASTKSVDHATAAPGDTLEYTLILTNTGNMNAYVSAGNPLLDDIPANTAFNGGLFASAGNIGYNAGFNRVEWYGTVPAGGNVVLRFRVKIAFPLDNGTLISNTAVINEGSGFSNPQTYNRTATTTVVAAPNLVSQSAKLVDKSIAAPGDILAYTIVLKNSGNMNAPNVTLTDTLPANVTWGGDAFMSATGGTVQFFPVTRTLIWNGDMNAGATVQILFRANVNTPLPNNTQIVNIARVSDVPGNFTPFTMQALTTIVSSPNLNTSTKAVNAATASPGSVLTYTLTLINTGNAVATTALTDTLPAELQSPVLISASSGMAQVVGNQILWSGLVTPTQNVIITFRATLLPVLNNGTQVANTALINDGANTPFFITPAAVTTIQSSPNLSTSLKRVNLTTAAPGDQLVYTIYLTNTGNMAADTVVRDVLPANVTFNGGLSAGPGAPLPTYSSINNRVDWQGTVVPGTVITVSYQVRINTPLDNGLLIQNDAEINDNVHAAFDTTPPAVTTIVSAPDLSTSSKSVDLTAAAPGDLLHYTLRLINTGNMIASGVSLSDTIPTQVTFASGPFVTGGGSGGWNPAQRRVFWSGSVTPGSDVIVEYYVTVNTPLPNGTQIVNDAQVSGSFPIVTTNSVTTTVSSDHALALSKTAPSVVAAGQALTYTLSWSVTGNEPAPGVVITDAIPANTTFSSCTGGCTVAGGVATWNLGNKVPGNSGSVTLVVTVSNLLPNGTLINNTANIFDAENAPVASSAQTTVSSGHGFSLNKRDTGYDPAQAGGTLVYNIDWSTAGTEVAQTVIITDALPVNTAFGSCSPAPCSLAGGIVTWNLGNRNPNASGTVVMTVTVASPLPNGTLLTNVARISDANGGLPSADTEQTTVQSSHALDVRKIAPATAAAGAQIAYTIVYTVTGNETAVNLLIDDTTPANTTFAGASGAGTIDAPAAGSTGLVRWHLGNVPPGTTGTVTLIVNVNTPLPNGTLVNNTASIYDSNGGTNDVASASTTVTSGHAFNLTKTDTPDPTTPDGFINYTIHWEVTGNETAQSVIITDSIPANTAFSNCGACVLQSGYVSWDLGSKAPGSSGDVFVQVHVNTPLPNGTVITNLARIGDSNGGTPVTASASTTVNSNHVLTLSKTAPSIVAAGQPLTYTLNWSVTGDEPAPGVVITDAIPANTTFLSCAGGCTVAGGVATWNLGNRVPGNSGSLTLIVTVSNLVPNGTVINNTARIFDADNGSAIATATTTVSSGHGFTLSKSDSPDPVQAGGALVYSIAWTTAGTEVAQNVVITDALPANVTYVSCSPAPCSQASGIVTWNLGNQNPNASGTVTVNVTVASPLPNLTLLTNIARISDANGGLPTTDTEQTTVQSSHVLSVKKTAPATVAAGAQIAYTIAYIVTGNETATNLIIEDTTPPNTTFASASGAATIDAPPIGSAGLVRWHLGNRAPGTNGTVTLVVNVNAPLPNGTIINNSASIYDSNGGTTASSNTSTTVGSSHAFSLSKFDTPDPVTPGNILNYTVHWELTGNEMAQSVVITDAIPANTSFWSCGGCSLQSGFVRWNLGLHFPGDNGDVTLQVIVNAPLPNGTIIDNTARISDANGGTPAQASASTTVSSDHNLTIDKSGPSAAAAGSQIVYSIAYQVIGTEIAPSVIITDAVPISTTYVANSCQPAANCSEAGGVVTWNLGNLTPGSAGSVQFSVRVDTGLPNGVNIINTAFIRDEAGKQGSDSVTTRIGSEATLTLNDDRATVQPGERITYTIGYNGAEPLTNGRIQLDLPANTTFIGGSSGYLNSGSAVFWLLAPLPPGFSDQRIVVVQVDPVVDNGTIISATAYLSGDGQSTNATDEASVVSAPHWATARKTADRPIVEPTARLTYTLMLSNTGNMHAHAATLEDPLPPQVTFVNGSLSATSGAPSYDSVSKRVMWSGSTQVGDAVKIVFAVTVNANAQPGTSIVNTAAVDDEVNAPAALSATVNVVAREPRTYRQFLPLLTRNLGAPELPDLTITSFTVVPNPVGVGVPGWDVLITVKNIGNGPLPNGVWMDLYIDPIRPPTVNTPFYLISPGPYGGVWWIPQLNPGESVVLSKDDILPDWLSFFPDTFSTPGAHTLYAQVDSLDERTANPPDWARVYELNEQNNIASVIVNVTALNGAAFIAPPALPELPERVEPR